MNRKGAVLLPILVVLIIVFLSLSVFSFYSYQKEHTQNIQLQSQIVDLEARQRIVEGKLDESKKLAAELQLKLQESKDKADSLANDFAQEKSAHLETVSQLERYKADLEQQKSLRQDLEDKLKVAQADGKKIKEQLKIIQQQKNELEQKIKNAEVGAAGVELGKVVVNNEPAAVVPAVAQGNAVVVAKESATDKKTELPQVKSLEGKIMVVNKEFNFAVINLGSKDHVSLGDEFLISRDGKDIGKIKVEKVHESMSAAGFAAELKDLIKENDKIVLKTK
ncbi:MAG: hypothetical protein WCY09_03330 [Candidatus Omnitrophota bacterium]